MGQTRTFGTSFEVSDRSDRNVPLQFLKTQNCCTLYSVGSRAIIGPNMALGWIYNGNLIDQAKQS